MFNEELTTEDITTILHYLDDNLSGVQLLLFQTVVRDLADMRYALQGLAAKTRDERAAVAAARLSFGFSTLDPAIRATCKSLGLKLPSER